MNTGPTQDISLRVEVWAESEPREANSKFFSAKHFSLREFYLLSNDPIDIEESFNFAAFVPNKFVSGTVDLVVGRARIVRREQFPRGCCEQFGVTARVDHIEALAGEDVHARTPRSSM